MQSQPTNLPTGVEPLHVDHSHWYTPAEELTPLPEQVTPFTDIVAVICDEDWTQSCSALLSVRRIVRHDSDAFKVHSCYALGKCILQTRNLRSVVCKTALLCCTEILETYEEELLFSDEDFATEVLSKLIEVSSSGKRFLAQQSRHALQAFLNCVSPAKFISFALSVVEHPNPMFRSIVVDLIRELLWSERSSMLQVLQLKCSCSSQVYICSIGRSSPSTMEIKIGNVGKLLMTVI